MDQLANINADLYDGTRIYRRRSDHPRWSQKKPKRVFSNEEERLAANRASSRKHWAANKERARARGHIKSLKLRYPESVADEGPWLLDVLEAWLHTTNGSACPYCGDEGYQIDHIVPMSKGGTHTWSNLQRVCKTCNYAKNNLMPEDFQAWMSRLIRHQTRAVEAA